MGGMSKLAIQPGCRLRGGESGRLLNQEEVGLKVRRPRAGVIRPSNWTLSGVYIGRERRIMEGREGEGLETMHLSQLVHSLMIQFDLDICSFEAVLIFRLQAAGQVHLSARTPKRTLLWGILEFLEVEADDFEVVCDLDVGVLLCGCWSTMWSLESVESSVCFYSATEDGLCVVQS